MRSRWARLACRLFGHDWRLRVRAGNTVTGEETDQQDSCRRCRAVNPTDPYDAGTCPDCGRSRNWLHNPHLDCDPEPAPTREDRP